MTVKLWDRQTNIGEEAKEKTRCSSRVEFHKHPSPYLMSSVLLYIDGDADESVIPRRRSHVHAGEAKRCAALLCSSVSVGGRRWGVAGRGLFLTDALKCR